MNSKLLGFITSMSILTTISAEENTQSSEQNLWIQNYLTQTPNFPIEGINFVSYENLMLDPEAFHQMVLTFADRYRGSDLDAIIGLDSRGFIFGTALAYELQVPFVMIRKAGKLPGKVERIDYSLEYGKNSFEIQANILNAGDRVVIIDDVLATGGTADAAAQLVERLGGEVVEFACLLELSFLNGREKVARPVYSLLSLD